MKRGVTLIELMVSVAVLGILAVIAGGLARHHRLLGIAELQHTEALLLLEYEGEAAAKGTPVDPAVVERLSRGLPDAKLSSVPGAHTVTFTVDWHDPVAGAATRSLTVFSR